jgi:hypothetical protein
LNTQTLDFLGKTKLLALKIVENWVQLRKSG